ncbi:hypothetical protein I2I11_09830 [Pontibacter sp. 172403-2]|uniref:hypothetical protein n=1 Tax=Pontibacter rufus TaxID=2791028 RepID=UPI0018AFF689|nr:hypothetical protein [Pontibacter sp. 172403-2]MBF9253590.1 hypothetical protein [Pontibacter sp. 172403-2]
MPLSIDNLRKGKKYRLRNYGEEFEFQVIDMPEDQVYRVKDLTTLDIYYLHDLIKYGKGKDFDLEDLES